MKIRSKKKVVVILLIVVFIILSVNDFNIVQIKNGKKHSLINNSTINKNNVVHKNFNYGDILNTINKCSSEFSLSKIEKNSTNKNFVNVEIKYKGEIEGLMEGLKIMKIQEIIKGINEINILKAENKDYIVEISVDFLKFK